MNNLYKWNNELYRYERIDRTQEYKGCKIETLSTHNDSDNPTFHREYRLTYPSGRVSYWTINKRKGGNIKDIKEYIDFKTKYGKI